MEDVQGGAAMEPESRTQKGVPAQLGEQLKQPLDFSTVCG